MVELPRGTVTFLFTDIAGSTALWEQDRAAMRVAVARQLAILHSLIEAHHGVLYKTIGDGTQAAFASAEDAVRAAVAAQRALLQETWADPPGPMRVRMALHAGEAAPQEGDYLATPLHRLSRLLAAGHGEQILLTQAVQQLTRGSLPVGITLRNLGEHRLRDLLEPEHIFQVLHPELPVQFPPLKTLAGRPHNLPIQLTPLIGREDEVAAIQRLIAQHDVRLATLTGPGGTGKTRLAQAVAAELLDDFPDGAWFVDLAPLRDPVLVLPTLALTLGLREDGGRSVQEVLALFLASKHVLLVLDNYEHLLEAAQVVSDLLQFGPGIAVLVTSRESLRLRGEREVAVAPLPVPDSHRHASRAGLAQNPAVALFVQRAQAVKADFVLTDENAAAVAAICARLDGLPLAIELAAARIKVLPPPALLSRLETRLPLLSGGPRDAPARQRTLRDTVAWSHNLLDAEERFLFRRLGIFAGGWTFEAAEAVANSNGTLDVLTGLSSLVDKSLVRQTDQVDGEPRYGMLETVREYGLERLTESGEETDVRDRHAAWCLGMAERHWVHEASWMEDPSWLALVEPEHDNVRAALAWLERTGDGAGLLRLAGALQPFWDVRGYRIEAVAWLERGLTRGQDAPLQARLRALAGLGRNLAQQGFYARAEDVHEALLASAREHGDALWEARALHVLSLGALNQERYDEATPLIEGAMAAFHRLGDEGGVCGSRYCSGLIAYGRGDLAAAAADLEAALAWRQDRGSVTNLTVPLNALGLVACDRGDHRAAAALLAEGLIRWEQDGGRSREVLAEWLAAVARLAACLGRPATAGRLYGAAEALFDAISEPLVVPPRSVYLRHVAALRDTLSAEAFAATWVAGRTLPLERVLAEAETVLNLNDHGAADSSAKI